MVQAGFGAGRSIVRWLFKGFRRGNALRIASFLAVFAMRFGKESARFALHNRRMSICLAHSSALAAWRYVRYTSGACPRTCRAGVPAKAKAAEVSSFRNSKLGGELLHSPLHLEVLSKNGKTSYASIVCHCSPALHNARLVSIDEGLLALSAEAMFAQLALSVSEIQLTMLAFELCGSFSFSPDGSSFSKAKPATSVRRLMEFLSARASSRGASRALRAIRFVVDGAASPAEARLVTLLCLKRTLGGYGLPLPKLNHKVDVARGVHKLTPRKYFVLDLYWESTRLDVEYDSDSFHLGAADISSDAARRNALQAMGYATITATRAQVASIDAFDDLARSIARALGKRVQNANGRLLQRRVELRAGLANTPYVE